ncbi:hypothetical protein CORC01_01415 [Colletotrichum orchidophilum]|uniref:Uncharacterized protein n=1 Tax=Colletotrichum orchidophilum TaxID=1209926 RepID=A0A1G4BPH1_9PEZI|nr:uncharacterized protein CORC01_01415 [Colletotrichum orchidophilum]OHF03362.1 hypothetical protein CORC01_01415 [Colletotrichum orchidophilum]
MTGRTLSNSSDISVVSTGSRSDADDLLMSGLNTPAYEKPKPGPDGFKMSTAPELCSPKGSHLGLRFIVVNPCVVNLVCAIDLCFPSCTPVPAPGCLCHRNVGADKD